MSQRPLPPLQSLRAFAAAARHQSLRDAAQELGVTPSAISHQVRALETWVGAPLFERGVRMVRLNETGRALSTSLNAAFGQIAEALSRARAASELRSLKIATLPLFAGTWLGKRLPTFENAHPDVTLSIHTDPRIYDVRAGEADVAIRNVDAPTPGLFARKLMDLRAVPLCIPAIAQGLSSPADLSRATLISLSVGRAGWKEWLATVGHPDLKPRRMIIVDTMLEAVAAAAQGRGIILGLAPLIYDAPGAEDLVAPFDAPPQPGGAYFIVCRSEDRSAGIAGAFVDWVIAEMRKDARRLQKLGRPA